MAVSSRQHVRVCAMCAGGQGLSWPLPLLPPSLSGCRRLCVGAFVLGRVSSLECTVYVLHAPTAHMHKLQATNPLCCVQPAQPVSKQACSQSTYTQVAGSKPPAANSRPQFRYVVSNQPSLAVTQCIRKPLAAATATSCSPVMPYLDATSRKSISMPAMGSLHNTYTLRPVCT